MKSPDNKRIGNYGVTILAGAHPDRINVVSRDSQGKPTSYQWADNSRTPAQRRGLTAYPTRDQMTQVTIYGGRSLNPKTGGVCSIAGSGPQVTAGVSPLKKGGYRFYNNVHTPMIRRRTTWGEPLGAWRTCGKTPDTAINLSRNFYQAGFRRALPNESVGQVIGPQESARLNAAYAAFNANPAAFGANPAFLVNNKFVRGARVLAGAPADVGQYNNLNFKLAGLEDSGFLPAVETSAGQWYA